MSLIARVMWVQQCHKLPIKLMVCTTHKNGDQELWGMVYYFYTNITHVGFAQENLKKVTPDHKIPYVCNYPYA